MSNRRRFLYCCVGGILGGAGIATYLKIYRRNNILNIVEHPNPVLRKISTPIERIDDKIIALSNLMISTLRYKALFQFFSRASLYKGLAAPQVGHCVRLIVCGLYGKIRVLVNPGIVERNGAYYSEEFCLSLPKHDTLVIKRPDYLKVKFKQLDNTETTLTANGSAAALLAHEIDHLDGVLYIDYESR